MRTPCRRPGPSLAVVALLLAAPLLDGVIPTDVIRIEDPEPLPDAPLKQPLPAVQPAMPDPAPTPLPSPAPESRGLQPAVPALQPPRPAPSKGAVEAPK